MPEIRYVGAIDRVSVPLLGRELDRGESVEVTDEQAKRLLEQVGNYEAVGGDALDSMTVDQLRHMAEEKGVDISGLTKKADISAAIQKG